MFMKLISIKLVILLVVAIISGCSEKRVHKVKNNDGKSLVKSNSHYSPDLIPVVAALHDQLNTWRTAPYQWGGTDIDGVDCSGFVWRTLKDRFNLPMKRVTTHDLIHMGVKVDKKIFVREILFSSKLKMASMLVFMIPTISLFTRQSVRVSPVRL